MKMKSTLIFTQDISFVIIVLCCNVVINQTFSHFLSVLSDNCYPKLNLKILKI